MKKHLLIFLTILFASHMLLAQRDEGVRPKGAVRDNPVPPSGTFYHTESIITEWSAIDLSGWNAQNWSLVGGTLTTGAYKAGQVSLLVSPDIQLPALTRANQRINAYLEESFELESYYDKGLVQVSADKGVTWTTLSSRDGRGASRSTLLALTTYAGKSIRLSLKLAADGANQYKGWDVKSLVIRRESLSDPLTSSIVSYANANGRGAGVTPLGVGTLGGAMNSVDAQKFPTFIFAQLQVTDNGLPLLSLDENNFFVQEYIHNQSGGADTLDAARDDTFLVYQPLDPTLRKNVDIVFLMDNSGSMSDKQAAVANNVESFCNQLATTNFNYQLGLCRFGQDASSGVPLFQNNAGWYTSTTDFVTMWRAVNVADGINEPSWDALYQSASQFTFRAGSQRIFILITDESITGNNLPINVIKDRQVVIDQLNGVGAKAYTLVPQMTPFDYDFSAISTATHARTYDIYSSFNDILTDIANQIQGTYIVRYAPPFNAFDGKKRNVLIKVKYNGNTLPLTGTYTPGVVPVVIRTDPTIALSATAQLNNQPLTITVNTYDNNPAYTTARVSLFYRTTVPYSPTSQPPYTEVAMTKGTPTGSNPIVIPWTYTLPANIVVGPGFQYYVKATNKEVSSGGDFLSTLAPEIIDRPGYPYSIPVLPNLPPVASHTPVTTVSDPKSTIHFTVTATDNTNSVNSVTLYVSTDMGTNYTAYPMTTSGNNLYEYTLAAVGTPGTVLYYIKVADNFGTTTDVGSLTSPYPIAVGVPFAPTPTLSVHRISLYKSTLPVTPATATFRGAPLVDGDVVAALYNDNGIMKAAGKLVWSTTANANLIQVYGNTNTTGAKNGYTAGDPLSFAVWRKATGETLNADYLVYNTPTTATPLNSIGFTNGKSSNLKELVALPEQAITLDEGYTLWSTYMTPRFTSLEYVLRPLASISPAIADAEGNTYTYGQTSGPLMNYALGQGYAIVLNAPKVLRIKGTEPTGSYPSLLLNGQGVIVGTPYTAPQSIERVFPPSMTSIFTVDRYLKDAAGNFTIETYSPLLGFNDWTYKNMEPGKGYMVTTDGSMINFTMPPFVGAYPARVASGKQATTEKLPQTITSFDRYMNILISKDAQKDVVPGSEIRVYNSTGKLVGRAIAQEQGVSIAVDGTRIKEQEPFTLRIFNKATNVEKYLTVTSWIAGNGTYQNRKPAVPGTTRVTATEEGESLIVFPNPVTSESSLTFKNAADQNVKIEIFDTQGSKVLHTVADQYFSKGAHTITIQRQSLPSGLYVIRKTSGASVETSRIMVK